MATTITATVASTSGRQDAQTGNNKAVKRRSACDECRSKKLKCTGETPTCSRCIRESIDCVYSPQKQMGRPKKRVYPEDETVPISNKDHGRDDGSTWNPDNENLDQPFDIEQVFTPGGSLQPWMQWNGDVTLLDDEVVASNAADAGVPDLVPDNGSSRSAPLNLPTEVRTTHQIIDHSNRSRRDDSTHLLLSSTLSGGDGSESLMPDCACLSTMYLTLNTLQSMKVFDFPFALHPLREAMQTASSVLTCEECPTRFITAIQNVQLVGTLLMSIAERFSKVLEHINSESVRAQLKGEQKKFRLADLNSSTMHLHTGGLGCVAAFALNMSPDEWKNMAKKVVRAEVEGPSEGNDCCCYLLGVIRQMEDRQERWHNDRPVYNDFPKGKDGTPRMLFDAEREKGEPLCLKFARCAKRLADGFDWS